jgi:hypothetical protein
MRSAREVNSEIDSRSVDSPGSPLNDARMSEIIYPRSSREVMDGWMHLPRYIDKIRLHAAGKLHADYHANLGKGFDAMWLKAAGVAHEQMIEVVKKSFIDGQVCDWVRKHVKKSPAEKRAHSEMMLNRPASDDAAAQERFKQRKQEFNLGHRDDVRTFVDLNDADEKRL